MVPSKKSLKRKALNKSIGVGWGRRNLYNSTPSSTQKDHFMENIFILIQIIILDGILSIDNAAALAGIANTLPDKPSPIKWLGKTQREAALKAGIFGAYAGRGLMLLLATFIFANPWLQIAGAIYLFYLVGTHFFGWSKWEPEFKGLSSFWTTVVMIEIADLAFSIDNVVAVVAISQHIWVVIFGVFISIIIMRFAAILFMRLIKWEPLLEHAAFVLIGAIAIELILKFFHFNIDPIIQFCISMGIIVSFIAYGQIGRRLGITVKEVTYE